SLPRSGVLSRLRALDWTHRTEVSVETLVRGNSVFFSLACNRMIWHASIATHPRDIGFAASLLFLLVAVHALLFGLLAWRWNAKPPLTLLFVTTAFATHYMNSYCVYLDADMLRNVLKTDHKESRELLMPALLWPLLFYAALPNALLWR